MVEHFVSSCCYSRSIQCCQQAWFVCVSKPVWESQKAKKWESGLDLTLRHKSFGELTYFLTKLTFDPDVGVNVH